jgi:3-deoxy-manno-octulosonate cytidylyltransferase (CMP-KDO synthetase)
MKIVGVIPSRWGSTRFPGKSLALLCGKPLVQWVVEGAQRARSLDALVVATDDPRIFDAVSTFGAKAVMTRSDHATGTDRIAEAVRGMEADVVINIQGDEPLIRAGLIDELARVMADGSGWDMATAARPIEDERDLQNPSVVKVVFDQEGRALYFSRCPIPYVREARAVSGEVLHWCHVGIYAYRRAFLDRFVRLPQSLLEKAESLEQLRALHAGARIAVLRTREKGIGVDTPEDVPYVEKILHSRESGVL